MILSRLWNLTVFLLLSSRTLLLSWVVSFSITVLSEWGFRKLSTSRNTATKLADNDVESTGYRYSSTPFHDGKGMLPSYSLPHDRTDEYTAPIFSGFMASPPPVGNNTFPFLLLSFSSLSVSTVFPSSIYFYSDLPAPQYWPGIWCWWITAFFGSTLIFLLLLSSMFSCFPWIETGNETVIPLVFWLLPWIFVEQ